MKFIRGLIATLLFLVLIASSCLSVLSAELRFVVLNPPRVKQLMITDAYVDSLRLCATDDLDYVGILYGFADGELDPLLDEAAVRGNTERLVDSLYENALSGGEISLSTDAGVYYNYMKARGGDDESALHFAEDCTETLDASLFAMTQPLVLDTVAQLIGNDNLAILSGAFYFILPFPLLAALLLLAVVADKRIAWVLITGGAFLGAAVTGLAFLQLGLSNYAGRLAFGESALGIQLSAFIRGLTNGCSLIALGTAGALLALLLIACFVRSGAKKGKKRTKA